MEDKKKTHLEYYDTHFVSPTILSRAQGVTPTLYGIRKVQEYQKLHIRYFANKGQFISYFEHSSIANNKAKLNQFWEEYQERDKLIASGEYSHIRDNIFKEEYIRQLEKKLKDKEDIQGRIFLEGIRKMNIKDFMDKYKLLPVIPSFYMDMSEMINMNNQVVDFETLNKDLKFDDTRYRQIKTFLKNYNISFRMGKNKLFYFPFIKRSEQGLARAIYSEILRERKSPHNMIKAIDDIEDA